LKTQVVVDENQRVICLAFANGKTHDFRVFKESKIHILSEIKSKADTGYIGIKNFHSNSETPHKRKKKQKLTKEQKHENHKISSERIVNENAIGFLKRFKILSERYRNRRKRFGLRFNLIAGVANFDRGL
jgi:hypothetical protein